MIFLALLALEHVRICIIYYTFSHTNAVAVTPTLLVGSVTCILVQTNILKSWTDYH